MAAKTTISSLPPEFLGEMALFLTIEHLGRLKLAGSKQLWAKLCDIRAVKSVEATSESITFLKLPLFLNELLGLENLTFSWSRQSEVRFMAIKLSQLPNMLRKLDFHWYDISSAPLAFQNGRFFDSSFDHALPYLEELFLPMHWDVKLPWMSTFPTSLKKLVIGNYQSALPLPSSLTEFSCGDMFIDAGLVPLPANLRLLKCRGDVSSIFHLIASLPVSLTDLWIYPIDFNGLTIENIAQLPRGLQHLSFSFQPDLRPYNNHEALIDAWPPLLLTLSMARAPLEFWKTIPRSVTRFKHCSPPSNQPLANDCPLSVLQDAWASLPSNQWTSLEFEISLGPFQPNFGSFSSLTSLDIRPFCHDVSDISSLQQLLPPSLTTLKIHTLDGLLATALPKGLRSLTVQQAYLSLAFWRHLPSALEYLKMTRAKPRSQSAHAHIGSSSPFPPSSPSHSRFSLQGRQASPVVGNNQALAVIEDGLQTQYENSDFSLPPHLKQVTFGECDFLNDSFLKKLPSMVRRLRFDRCAFSDQGMHFITQHPLTVLLITYGGLSLSSACFAALPRSLHRLRLNETANIFDEHIRDLPRDLCQLHVPNATALTRACLPDLPPRLNVFEATDNQNIVPEDLPLFPFKYQSPRRPSFSAHFIGASFSFMDGTLRRRKTS